MRTEAWQIGHMDGLNHQRRQPLALWNCAQIGNYEAGWDVGQNERHMRIEDISEPIMLAAVED